MDHLICASLSHTHYWYEVGMLKVPAVGVRVWFFRVCIVVTIDGTLHGVALLCVCYILFFLLACDRGRDFGDEQM